MLIILLWWGLMKPIHIKLSPWQDGVSWQSNILNRTLKHTYYDDAGVTLQSILKSGDGQSWAKTVPEESLDALLKFEHKYHELALSCLWFVSRSRYAEELLHSSTFLTWFILKHAVRHKLPQEDVFSLFVMKRKSLLALDKLPPDNKLLNFFEYLDQQGMAVKEYKRLKKIILKHGYEDLAQFKIINDQILRLLISSPELLQYRFMKNLTTFKNVKNLLMMSGEIRLLGYYYEPDHYQQKLMKCKSETALKRLHQDYLKRDWQLSQNLIRNEVFPFPPIQGNENIQYIRFKKELINEGDEMNHCVAGYIANIMKGRYFVFKVLSPQRATLGLEIFNGKLTIDQVKLKNNLNPSKATVKAIEAWLF